LVDEDAILYLFDLQSKEEVQLSHHALVLVPLKGLPIIHLGG
jgi:hypothetical protein